MFTYNKELDKSNWQRLVKNGACFGREFPASFSITDEKIKQAEAKAVEYDKAWEKYKDTFYNGMQLIFKKEFPKDVSFYVNTSPYSYYNVEKKYISLSVECDRVIPYLLHEANHYMVRKYHDSKEVREKNVHEIVSVVNNDVFAPMQDRYWPEYEKIREKAFDKWMEEKDIKKVIDYIVKIY